MFGQEILTDYGIPYITQFGTHNKQTRNNGYAWWKKVAVQNKYGDGIPEIQDVLKEWEVDIDMASRKHRWNWQCLRVSHMGYNVVLFTYF